MSKLTMSPPFMISARLLPAIKVAECTISLELTGRDRYGRYEYTIYFDFDDGREFTDGPIGVSNGKQPTREAFCFLFTCLNSAGEASYWQQRTGEEPDSDVIGSFCPEVIDWLGKNYDEIQSVAEEIDEHPELIVETTK